MMRVVLGSVTLIAVALVAPAWSGEDVYSWKDSSGRLHFTNTAAARDEPEPAATEPAGAGAEPVEPAAATDDASEEAVPVATAPLSEDESSALSASVSLRRNEIERDLRNTERSIKDLDSRLGVLAHARKSQGAPAGAGVLPGGIDLRSEEEKDLTAKREELAQHTAELRSQAAKLKQEVTAKLGGTPSWWIDVR
jgi:hypothetical protein